MIEIRSPPHSGISSIFLSIPSQSMMSLHHAKNRILSKAVIVNRDFFMLVCSIDKYLIYGSNIILFYNLFFLVILMSSCMFNIMIYI